MQQNLVYVGVEPFLTPVSVKKCELQKGAGNRLSDESRNLF